MKPRVLVILGQTATGKSDLAVKLAKKVNGEIISADSRQVYKGLNIGTGKITKKEMRGIPHHLLDIADPRKQFNAAEYKKLADEKIKEILSRGKVPIICGGTGFYIDAITKGFILPEVPPNKKLRKILGKKHVSVLFKILKKLDKNRAKNIDPKNKVRIIRAIEIASALGKVPKIQENKSDYKFIKIGLYLPEKKLREKINERLLGRIKKGMLKEGRGLSNVRMKELGLEYKHISLYRHKNITKAELIEKLNTEIYQYAKRQMTWFKRDQEIQWFHPREYQKIEKYIRVNFNSLSSF
ncbi:tRNA (adenosine(37)-N6)-dimethylallyltransferase MiaA [Candidatus Nomurabacteria bacterium RIFCSPLOWO2_02_FULL_44_12]|uniref:tRNA dimethylallyltransferase n=1 Tax=Candidatus Nomurabacteria bacterium RIFCSPLOWO2_12_FULL_44_11 TaxID=1801796 RepID=A0A1F6Y7U4_9BACT|nr:MAG: tRNA (adenosine(37)-N6)-dimethylallyltransferase MiaA [Candidatus Nomurabacteria bacterium RIFCSPHIGHO2_12_FULL_44_22b]OGJ02433.1 MAG: tRNA (adenosine(37)-N6)-dimethylallyltransferase MiaA [Candidatus Nomurabacteria bacterium RIFCSPLOWO2_12_FULL_44_11]OGJ07032.1 MAG: tRNA (adenosine(37)-N6)-dimethylallyltransferase MiaA [Candidatus Nomurabacteria bacterium RIFCSPLOWO2_02_FULL_44_12]